MSREEITAFLSKTRLLAIKDAIRILESLELVAHNERDAQWHTEVAQCRRVINSRGRATKT